MLRELLFDIETDGLDASKVHCVSIMDLATSDVQEYGPSEIEVALAHLGEATSLVGHNIMSFDLPVLKRLYGFKFDGEIVDTLVLSRLAQPVREGGHSLDAWGAKLGYAKVQHEDWSEYSEAMQHRCSEDVRLNAKVFRKVLKELEGVPAETIRAELDIQSILQDMQEHGMPLDMPKVLGLLSSIRTRKEEIEYDFANYPALPVFDKEITLQWSKDGERKLVRNLKGFDPEEVEGNFSRIVWVPFNPGSTQQKIKRLEGWWAPKDKTPGGSWKLSEANLATIREDAPQELKNLGEYAMLSSRSKVIEGWMDALGSDDRVHGSVMATGASTGRMAHRNPNMANVPGSRSPYGREFRECFIVDRGYKMVGFDLAGVQLRVLASFMDDPDYIEQVCAGDIHEHNLSAMGVPKGVYDPETGHHAERHRAKTFIYSYLMGAGDKKLAEIAKVKSGSKLRATFLGNLPKLKRLYDRLNMAVTKRGYLILLDGRRIPVSDTHYAMPSLLQGQECVLMKHVMLLIRERCVAKGLDVQFLSAVHDELQTMVRVNHVEEYSQIALDAVVVTGEKLGFKCPMAGEVKIGENWYETH